ALFDSALHVPSSMEIQHEWRRQGVRRVDTRRNGAVHARNRHVLNTAYRDQITREGGRPEIAECLSNLCDRSAHCGSCVCASLVSMSCFNAALRAIVFCRSVFAWSGGIFARRERSVHSLRPLKANAPLIAINLY